MLNEDWKCTRSFFSFSYGQTRGEAEPGRRVHFVNASLCQTHTFVFKVMLFCYRLDLVLSYRGGEAVVVWLRSDF